MQARLGGICIYQERLGEVWVPEYWQNGEGYLQHLECPLSFCRPVDFVQFSLSAQVSKGSRYRSEVKHKSPGIPCQTPEGCFFDVGRE